LKKHKPWFDDGWSKLLDQRKQGKLQWIQDPNEINGGILNNVSHETSRHFRNKRREYLKDLKNHVGLEMNETHQLLAYNIDTINKNTESFIDASKEVGL
jgi:hypothetical protein